MAIAFDVNNKALMGRSRWEFLASECGSSIAKVKSAMIEMDVFEIIPAINTFVAELNNPSEFYVYIGITSESQMKTRFSAHGRAHGKLFIKEIKRYSQNRFGGCVALASPTCKDSAAHSKWLSIPERAGNHCGVLTTT